MMTSKTQLQTKIQEFEKELASFKSQLNNYKPVTIQEANVGDTLEDGSIVLQKSNGLALLVAPKSTEVELTWSQDFPEVYVKLKEHGFNSSQWFVPTKEQLKLAYEILENEFDSAYYWSSTEIDFTFAFSVFRAREHKCYNTTHFCVRAFRCVTY